MIRHLIGTAGRLVRAQWLALLAIAVVLTGTTAAYAATVGKNSVVSLSIKDGQVKRIDLKNGAVNGSKLALNAVTGDHVVDGGLTGGDLADGGVTGTDVGDDSLTGNDVNESSLGTVPNASSLGGQPASAYLRGSAYVRESALQAGTDKGDGTFVVSHTCDAGDLLLSGGPANVNAASDMVESFPSPGVINGWSVRIHKNAAVDTFSVVVLCLNTV